MSCADINCSATWRRKSRFFRFPADPERRTKWTENLKREGWVPGRRAVLCSVHFEESQFEQDSPNGVKKLKKNAVPTVFDGENAPRASRRIKEKDRSWPESVSHSVPVDHFQSLKMDDSLAPGNAHIVRIVPLGYEDKILEQDNESEIDSIHEQERDRAISESDSVNDQERESAISVNEEEEHDPLVEKEFAEKIPETEFVTYLLCDADQDLPNLSQDFSLALSDNSQSKESSTINNMIETSPIMSKIVQIESKIEKDELKKTEMLYKISMLESKIEKFREQREKDRRRIKALVQSQRRNFKKIASLKESVTVLKQQKYIAHAKSEILKVASPSLLEILGEDKCQNKNKTDSKRHSFAVCDFAKSLYSISPDAYKYVRNYFDASLPSEKAVSSWIHKKNRDSDNFNSFDDCVDVQDFIDEEAEVQQVNGNGQEFNIQSTSESFLSL